MSRAPWRSAVLALGLLLMTGSAAWAQRSPHYSPVRPPISPYLYYSAINTTGLPNYFTYVRPAIQFQAFTQRRAFDARLETRVRMDDERVTGIVERQLRLRETTGLGAPAVAGTFMDFSHYYPPSGVVRRR
jgi:hypothetical protein